MLRPFLIAEKEAPQTSSPAPARLHGGLVAQQAALAGPTGAADSVQEEEEGMEDGDDMWSPNVSETEEEMKGSVVNTKL